MNTEQLKKVAAWAYPDRDVYIFEYKDNEHMPQESVQMKIGIRSSQFFPHGEPEQELHLLRKYREWLIDSNRHVILTSQTNAALMLKATESTEELLKAVYRDCIKGG